VSGFADVADMSGWCERAPRVTILGAPTHERPQERHKTYGNARSIRENV
jgi:hypothetical protein